MEDHNDQENDIPIGYKRPPALTFTPSPENIHPIMVTPNANSMEKNHPIMVTPNSNPVRQELFHVRYNTPKSRSSTQTSTNSYRTNNGDSEHEVLVYRQTDNKASNIEENFVTPTVLQPKPYKDTHENHRRRHKGSRASTTRSSLISNSDSPSRKILGPPDKKAAETKAQNIH